MTGFLDCRTDGTDTILLKLKIKKIYKISNIRELSKDVFYLFYTLKRLDISGVFTEQMCERMCAT